MYNSEEFDEQKTKVMKYIIYKKRTEHEVRLKFEKIIEENMLEDIIEYLKEAKYIDDGEYIKRAINNFYAIKNLSIREVKQKLIAKGIDKNMLEEYIYNHKEEMNEYEKKSIQKIISKKQETSEKEEIKQYLLKKGYNQENLEIELEDMYC